MLTNFHQLNNLLKQYGNLIGAKKVTYPSSLFFYKPKCMLNKRKHRTQSGYEMEKEG